MMFRSISDESQIGSLVSLSVKRDTSAGWVRGLLERGVSRPLWCRMASSDGGDVLAAHVRLLVARG